MTGKLSPNRGTGKTRARFVYFAINRSFLGGDLGARRPLVTLGKVCQFCLFSADADGGKLELFLRCWRLF
jgi:hypothetical protein